MRSAISIVRCFFLHVCTFVFRYRPKPIQCTYLIHCRFPFRFLAFWHNLFQSEHLYRLYRLKRIHQIHRSPFQTAQL